MAADSGIDPRYAAQFQRGFDPATQPVVPEPRGPLRIAGGPPPRVEQVPPPPRIGERPAAPPVVEPSAIDDAPGEDTAPAFELRWQWALPVLAGALIVAAVVLFGMSATDTGIYSGNLTQEEYLLADLRGRLPGPLLVAGVLALSVWLVARGLHRGARR